MSKDENSSWNLMYAASSANVVVLSQDHLIGACNAFASCRDDDRFVWHKGISGRRAPGNKAPSSTQGE